MEYKVIPLFYSAGENFKNTTRFSIEFKDPIDKDVLRYAVDMTKKRYPYFSVRVEKKGEEYVLVDNTEPFVISENNDAVCLNSPESNYHLVAFAFKDRIISVDASHFICDGGGVLPMFQTLAYYYIEKKYGDSKLDPSAFRLVDDPINEEEYAYPFPDEMIEDKDSKKYELDAPDVFVVDDSFYEGEGPYTYNIQLRQDDLMRYAKANDGSPVSCLSLALYRTVIKLFADNKKDIVFEIPHTFRKALNRFLSHDCLANVLFVKLPVSDADKTDAQLNADLRKQISSASDLSMDIQSINGMVQLGAYLNTMPLAAKIQTMQGVVGSSMQQQSFGISYTGNFPWNGLERYIDNVYAYAGERKHNGCGLEVFVIGDYFSVTIMMPGKNPAFVEEFMRFFKERDVECRLASEGTYSLCDYRLPE